MRLRFLIADESASGVFNLTSPNPVTNIEFEKMISKVMQRPYYFPIPSFAMQMAFGEVASMVLKGQRVIPAKLLKEGYEFRFPNLQEALIDLLRN